MRAIFPLVVLFGLAACGAPGRAASGPPPHQALFGRVDGARLAVTTASGPRTAQEYAAAVHDALVGGAYHAMPQRFGFDLPDAIRALDAALPTAGADAPLLVAWRALLLADNGQPDDAVREYERSLALGPNRLAATFLVDHHGRAGQSARVHEICGATVPALLSPDDKFELMEACRRASNAISEAAAFPWASPDVLAWYQGERARRAQVAAAQQQAQQQAQQAQHQAAADTTRRERDEAITRRLCFDECRDTALACDRGCGDRLNVDMCHDSCERDQVSCRRRCE